MTIKLRGHHLLCLLGFRGKGYSADFCVNMTQIYEKLRQEPNTHIQLIIGPDDVCAAFPTDQLSHCENRRVYTQDEEIARLIGIRIGESWTWSSVCKAVAARVQPSDIATLCHDCQWQPYGLCREGVAHIHQEPCLRSLPES